MGLSATSVVRQDIHQDGPSRGVGPSQCLVQISRQHRYLTCRLNHRLRRFGGKDNSTAHTYEGVRDEPQLNRAVPYDAPHSVRKTYPQMVGEICGARV